MNTGQASPDGTDGPILGTIICLAGIGAVGFTIYDVWDQVANLLQDRADMIAAENRVSRYLKQITGEEGGDQALFELYAYIAEQARYKYQADVHGLSEKMHISEYTLGVSVLSCAAAVGAPTP